MSIGMAVDASHNLWVMDSNIRVQLIDKNLNFIEEFTTYLSQPSNDELPLSSSPVYSLLLSMDPDTNDIVVSLKTSLGQVLIIYDPVVGKFK